MNPPRLAPLPIWPTRRTCRRPELSSSRVIADLVETSLAAKEREKERFFELAEPLARASATRRGYRVTETMTT